MKRLERPDGYPSHPSAGIYDAESFTVGNGQTWHRPRFYRGVQVIGWCGVYGFTEYFGVYPDNWSGQDYETRPAVWGDGDSLPQCAACR